MNDVTMAATTAQEWRPSPRRFLSNCLNARTPFPGLYLTGQDVGSAGLTGAMMGGMLSAATVEPRVLACVT